MTIIDLPVSRIRRPAPDNGNAGDRLAEDTGDRLAGGTGDRLAGGTGDRLAGDAGDRLAFALRDDDAQVRRAAAEALIDEHEVLVGEAGVRTLTEVEATARDPYVRSVAAELVRAMRAAAWDIYEAALADREPSRAETIRGLTLLRAATELGEIALTDPDWRIRRQAVHAIGRLDSQAAIGPLTSALEDEIVAVRRTAVRALARWATTRHYAHAALTTALQDPDPGVRAEARWTLA